MKYLNFLVLSILISCGSGEVRQNIETSYATSGVEQFFLPELPTWANASGSGQCFKGQSTIYLDFSKLVASYQLSYLEMIELQAQYNERLENYFRSTAVRFLKPVEESSFFSNTLEQVRGGIRHFRLPKVQEVEVVWLDSYIKSGKIDDIKKLANSGRFDQKLPILFSSCFSRQGLNQWLSEHNMEQAGFFLLSAEWLSPFGSDAKLKPGLRVELAKLLEPNVKIHFLSAEPNITPNELVLK